jgi:hypothetical protein
VKRWLAGRLRTWADRLDWAGAPKPTGWSFTVEGRFGTVFNQDGRGCPLWSYDEDYLLLRAPESGQPEACEDIEWVTIGMRTPDGVHVLGSAEVPRAETTRRMYGYDEVRVPGARRTAKVPRWHITLRCELASFVSLPGNSYPEALQSMFGRAGIKG